MHLSVSGVLGTGDSALDLQGLAVQSLGLHVLALSVIDVGQILHGLQRIEMLRAQDPAVDFQGLRSGGLRLPHTYLVDSSDAKTSGRIEGLGILSSFNPPV